MIQSESLIKIAGTVPRLEPYFEEPRSSGRAGPKDVRQSVAAAVTAGSSYPLVTSACRAAIADAGRPGTFDTRVTSALAYGAAVAGFLTERWTGLSGVAVRAAIEKAQPYVTVQTTGGLRRVTDIDFAHVSTDNFFWSTAGVVAAARKEPFAATRPSFARRIRDLDTLGHQRIIQHVVDTCTELVDQHVARAAVVRTLRDGPDLLLSVHLDTAPFGLWASRRCLRTTFEEQLALSQAALANTPPAPSRRRPPHPKPIVGTHGDLASVRDVAKRLGVSTATVYRLCESGDLVHLKVGSSIRVAAVDLAAFINQRRTAGRGP